MAQYAVRRAFADVILSGYSTPHRDRVRVYVVNDRAEAWTGIVDIHVRRWSDGRITGTVTKNVTAAARAATLILQASVTALLQYAACDSNSTCFVSLHATSTDAVGEGWIFLAPVKLVALPSPNVTVEMLDPIWLMQSSPFPAEASSLSLVVRLASTAPAPYLFLETPLPGLWSDNGFLLLPDSPRTLTFTSWERQITAEQLRANLTVLTTHTTIAQGQLS